MEAVQPSFHSHLGCKFHPMRGEADTRLDFSIVCPCVLETATSATRIETRQADLLRMLEENILEFYEFMGISIQKIRTHVHMSKI